MKKVFFALISSFFLMSSAFADSIIEKYEEDCKALIERPKVSLSSSYGRLRYRFDKDPAYLKEQAMRKQKGTPGVPTHSFETLGFTKVNDIFDFDFSVAQLDMGHGYICVYPEEITARLEYLAPTIFVANNLVKDSCLFNLTLRHEKTHMQIYIEALDYFLPKLKSYMDHQFEKIGVKVVLGRETVEKSAQELSQIYLKSIQNKVDEWRQEVGREQAKLDTPEHYVLESQLCDEILP